MSALLWTLTALLAAACGALAFVAAGWRHRALEAERSLRVEQAATPRACLVVQMRERGACARLADDLGAVEAAAAIRARSGEASS